MTHEQFPLMDAVDHEILMHRDAHFGGQFSIMLDYYKNNGKGVNPEFDIPRIERLSLLEEQLKQNLAALFLSASEMQKVADSRAAYQKLRAIYEFKNSKTSHPRLIADLILTEEEEPEAEIGSIVAEKDTIVSDLIDLLRSDEFYDPLFPGFGQAPNLAAQALGRIGDKRAIITLFEALGQADFFEDEQIIKAMKAIGDPARDFLLRVLKGRPINQDNEKAAIALVAFENDPEVADLSFELLQQADIQKDLSLPTYLAAACAWLKDGEKRKAFAAMASNPSLPTLLRQDIQAVVREWK